MILGGADCVWDDVRALEALLGHEWDGLVIAVNDIGVHWPGPLDHWCTLHPEKMAKWTQERTAKGHDERYLKWGGRNHKNVDNVARGPTGGSSGMLACNVAAHIGMTHVVLCGVPMTRVPHFHESTIHKKGKPWSSADSHWRAWRKDENRRKLQARARSMSGRTAELLGMPTLEWFGVYIEEAA
jgi:hypothetical protein